MIPLWQTNKCIKTRLVVATRVLHLILLQCQYQHLWMPCTMFCSVLLIWWSSVLFICFHFSLDIRHLNNGIVKLEGTNSVPYFSVLEGSAVLWLKIKILKSFWTKHLRNQYFHFPPGNPLVYYYTSSATLPVFLYFATCCFPFCTVSSPSACSPGILWKAPLFFPSLTSCLLSFSLPPLHLPCQTSHLTWLIWTCAFFGPFWLVSPPLFFHLENLFSLLAGAVFDRLIE